MLAVMDLLHVYSKQLGGIPPVQSLVTKAKDSRRRGTGSPVVKRARQLRPDEIEALIAHYRDNGSVTTAAPCVMTAFPSGLITSHDTGNELGGQNLMARGGEMGWPLEMLAALRWLKVVPPGVPASSPPCC